MREHKTVVINGGENANKYFQKICLHNVELGTIVDWFLETYQFKKRSNKL